MGVGHLTLLSTFSGSYGASIYVDQTDLEDGIISEAGHLQG